MPASNTRADDLRNQPRESGTLLEVNEEKFFGNDTCTLKKKNVLRNDFPNFNKLYNFQFSSIPSNFNNQFIQGYVQSSLYGFY